MAGEYLCTLTSRWRIPPLTTRAGSLRPEVGRASRCVQGQALRNLRPTTQEAEARKPDETFGPGAERIAPVAGYPCWRFAQIGGAAPRGSQFRSSEADQIWPADAGESENPWPGTQKEEEEEEEEKELRNRMKPGAPEGLGDQSESETPGESRNLREPKGAPEGGPERAAQCSWTQTSRHNMSYQTLAITAQNTPCGSFSDRQNPLRPISWTPSSNKPGSLCARLTVT